MSNMDLWNRYADIDPSFTKPISGRDYKGTSPNPQYVIRCLTEMFGPVGKGFGWSVLKEEFTPLGETLLHWCRIKFWWKDGEGIHEVEEYGQTKAYYLTSGGYPKSDEDAPKKSLTDAIIKGASHMGVAANIFLGRWDDQKYVDEVKKDFAAKSKAAHQDEASTKTSAQLKREGAWETVSGELENDLIDCHSLVGLEKLKDAYRSKVAGWAPAWKNSLKDMFDAHEDKLIRQREAEEVADHVMHPLMAGE